MRKLTPSTARTTWSWTRNSIARFSTESRSLASGIDDDSEMAEIGARRLAQPDAVGARRHRRRASDGDEIVDRGVETDRSARRPPRTLERHLHPAPRPVAARGEV